MELRLRSPPNRGEAASATLSPAPGASEVATGACCTPCDRRAPAARSSATARLLSACVAISSAVRPSCPRQGGAQAGAAQQRAGQQRAGEPRA